jgi:TatD DNase family protein
MIFETHAHYDDARFDEDRHALLSAMPEHGVGTIVNVGADWNGCEQSIALAKQYDFVYAAVGIHPSSIEELTEEHLTQMQQMAAWEKTVAVGEIGLDYYWEKDEAVQAQQKIGFEKQLDLAGSRNLPVIIHSRDAAEATMEILAKRTGMRGVIHCYSYSKEMALDYVNLGYYIGVGGVVTFKNSKKLKETVQAVGLEHIVLETDCPYLAPEPYRGKRNDSTLISYVAEEIARLTDTTVEDVISITRKNAEQLLRKYY